MSKQEITPCIHICTMDATDSFCLGCMRTDEEICEWEDMPDEMRLCIMEDLKTRSK